MNNAFQFFDERFKSYFVKQFITLCDDYQENYNMDYVPFFENYFNEFPNEIHNYLISIKEDVKNKLSAKSNYTYEGCNAFFNNALFKKVQHLIAFFPMWTNLIKIKENALWNETKYFKIKKLIKYIIKI